MQKLEFALQFEKLENAAEGYPAIIVAAGSSSRMNGIDKQFALLGGIPVLARTLRAFENSRYISEITVVTREDKIPDIKKLAERYAVSKVKNVIVGGSCREESVKNGVELYRGKCSKILIHDGARPLVSEETIKGVAMALAQFDSVTCGVTPKDTVKCIGKDGIVQNTPDRDTMVLVQTPQGVNVDKFLQVADSHELNGFTDDTSVMEFLGIPTKITAGDYTNIKITTPEDVLVAEGYIRKEW